MLAVALAAVLDNPGCLLDLLAGGQQVIAVQQGPAVVLGVGQFDFIGTHLVRQVEDRTHFMQVLGVQHRVHGERQANLAHPAGHLELLLPEGPAGDDLHSLLGGALQAQLEAAQVGFHQLVELAAGQANAAGAEVGEHAALVCPVDELEEVGAQEGFSA